MSIDSIARGLAVREANVTVKRRLLDRIRAHYAATTTGIRDKNGVARVMASPPTISTSASAPALTKIYSATYPAAGGSTTSVFRLLGGAAIGGGSTWGRLKTSVIFTSGGNLATNDGAQGSASRVEFCADAAVVVIDVGRSAGTYRFLVDDQYVDLTGTLTTASSPFSTHDYITLDFTAVGGRKVRRFAVEPPPDGGITRIYVAATESAFLPHDDFLRIAFLGDSYVHGTNATHRCDSFIYVAADMLGFRAVLASGSSGTGWDTPNTAYRFDERITNGDLALGGTPDVIVLMGSVNDNGRTMANVTSRVTAGLIETRRQFPNALIILTGVWPYSLNANSPTTEAAVLAGWQAWTDPKGFSFYIPICADTVQVPIYGTGYIGGTTGTGNADVYVDTDKIHPSNASGPYRGAWLARKIMTGIGSLGI